MSACGQQAFYANQVSVAPYVRHPHWLLLLDVQLVRDLKICTHHLEKIAKLFHCNECIIWADNYQLWWANCKFAQRLVLEWGEYLSSFHTSSRTNLSLDVKRISPARWICQ